jgi:DmsE family decaheme c-type cytochrome
MSYSGKTMKRKALLKGYRTFFFFLAVTLVAGTTTGRADDQQFKLRPGARGQICLGCHVDMKEKLKAPFVHTPVKQGNCAGCHNPHASSHDKMLSAGLDKICSTCHGNMIPENAQSVHKVVASGDCTKCHDPHASKNKFNLVRQGKALCFGCHKEMGETVGKAQFKHPPVENDCTSCHNPHASSNAKHLLVDGVPSLCLKCHNAKVPVFMNLHMKYPVEKGNCTSCHSVHGSSRGALLYPNAHVPVANRMCGQCHEDPTSPTPFKTKKQGYELCRGCHSDLINDIFSKNIIHWPVVGGKGCISCHSPHGSPRPKLLRGTLPEVCGKCHADTLERGKKSLEKHPPVQEGNCTGCHSPHSSDFEYIGKYPVLELCGQCHSWKAHVSHPLGEKAVDKRNSNLRVTCLSCHRSHGTEFKKMMPFKTPTDLCIQCHKAEAR